MVLDVRQLGLLGLGRLPFLWVGCRFLGLGLGFALWVSACFGFVMIDFARVWVICFVIWLLVLACCFL